MRWLDRFRKLGSENVCQCQPCQPCQSTSIRRERGAALNLSEIPGTVGTVGTGTSSEIEPAADAPGRAWTAYFDRQISLLDQDLAAKGTSFNRALAAMRPKRRKRSQEEVREARRRQGYLADFAARPGAPLIPCGCRDTVFYQLVGDRHWRCLSCERITARARVRWYVLDQALGQAVRQVREAFPEAVVAEVRARRRGQP